MTYGDGSPTDGLSQRIRQSGLTAWALIGIALLVYGFFRYLIQPLLVIAAPVAVGIVIVYLLNPLVGILERRGARRWIAVLLVFLVFIAVAGTALSYLIPYLIRQFSHFINGLPELVQNAVDWINSVAERTGAETRIQLTAADVQELITENRGTIASFIGGVGSVAGQLVHLIIVVVIGLVLSVYVLLDLPKMQAGFRRAIPAQYRDEVLGLGEKIGGALGGFFRGQLLVALFVGVASALALSIVRVPYAPVIGLIAGIFNLVPLIGPFIGAIPAVVVSLLSDRPIRALYAALALLIVQQIDNHIVSPNVMGRTVRLHAITVMLALLVGGSFAGIFGMLVTIPAVATLKIIGLHLWSRRYDLGMTEPASGAP